jgi:hypothetical protein
MTYPTKEDEERFELELGRFTIRWAGIEHELYRVLRNYSGVTDAVGRALFGGCRARDFIKHIKNIAHNVRLDTARIADLEFVFPQLNAINDLRDKIIHQLDTSYIYPSGEPQKRVLTNSNRVTKYGAHFEYLIDPVVLKHMCSDLDIIHNHLNLHWGHYGDLNGGFKAHEDDVIGNKWHFKMPTDLKNTP